MTVTYNSTGTGNTGSDGSLTWTHTITTADEQTVVLVVVGVSSLFNLGPLDNSHFSATYGGQEMTFGVFSETGVILDGVFDVFGGGIASFYLFDPPTGEQTVEVEASGFGISGFSGNSVAYDGCIGFAGFRRTFGAQGSLTIPTITGDRVVTAWSTGFPPSIAGIGTHRFSEGATYVGTGDYISVQDATGNQQVTLGLSNYLISGIRGIGINLAGEVDHAARCRQILEAVRKQRRDEDKIRRTPPLCRVWDGEWQLQHLMQVEYSAQFALVSNDSGPAKTEIPMGTPVADWIDDMEGRVDREEGRNVHITVDYCGSRWGGRLDKAVVECRDDGDKVLVCDWLHDYENLKWYQVWSNPFLPAAIQFPKAFMLAGPVTWILKTALFLQIFREHNPLITIVDDPLDFASWFTSLDQSTWAVVVKPLGFLEAVASGVVWGIVFSRWQNWHDMAKIMLEDAELSVVTRRYLPGDPPPWPGANLRYGCLVVDIVDKSGTFVGTSHGGTIFDGLLRTVAEFAEDFIDSTLDVALDVDYPNQYLLPWSRLTRKELPYVVYRQIEGSPIQASELIKSPSKGIQVNVGGHSAPGVNEVISASIQAIGDVLGGLLQIGSLGGTIDTLLAPLYEDTILAWWSVKSIFRAQNSGWSRYFEYQQEPTGKAYTIASLMVLRAGFWATRTVISWKVEVSAGDPYLVGDNGVGHFWLDDRIGLVLDGSSRIHMDRCRKIELAWDADNPPEWRLTVGDDRNWQDPAARAWGRIEQMVAGMKELGVW